MRYIILAAAILLASCGSDGSTRPPVPPPAQVCDTSVPGERWFEDNNMGSAGGLPGDFFTRLDTPDTWADARDVMQVYMLRRSSMGAISDADLARMADLFDVAGISVAVNDGAATWAHHRLPGLEFTGSIRVIQRMLDAGMDVRHIVMQSILSKKLKDTNGDPVAYPMETRYADAEAYIRKIRNAFPDRGFKFGLVDASPSHDPATYKQIWSGLKTHLNQAGLPFDFFHLDMPFVIPREQRKGLTWEGMDAIGDWVQARGLDFGIFLNEGRPNSVSDASWRRLFLEGIDDYLAACGDMNHWILAGWHPYPTLSVPDTPTLATSMGVFNAMDAKLTAAGYPNPKP